VRILPQAEVQAAELHVEVPENYGGNFPLYLIKVSLITGWATTSQVLLLLPPAPLLSFALALL
jgi:hypothetical protein